MIGQWAANGVPLLSQVSSLFQQRAFRGRNTATGTTAYGWEGGTDRAGTLADTSAVGEDGKDLVSNKSVQPRIENAHHVLLKMSSF